MRICGGLLEAIRSWDCSSAPAGVYVVDVELLLEDLTAMKSKARFFMVKLFAVFHLVGL